MTACALGLALLAAVVPPGGDRTAGGDHWRLKTLHGAIHVWRPDRFDPRTAGTVVYVHGYFTTADKTWEDDRLAEQFAASSRNALFVVSEAPADFLEDVSWSRVEDLLAAVREGTGLERPSGPVVTIGHSGAFRTLVPWLRSSTLDQVVLLDAAYGDVRPFRAWVTAARSRPVNRMILVAGETAENSLRLARGVSGAVWRNSIPDSDQELKPAERRARLLCLRSQYTHMELVTRGVLSLLLRLAPLKQLSD